MIQFYRGLRAKYNYPTNLLDAIYFATDTGELLVNGVNYGIDNIKIKDAAFNTITNVLTFTKGDNSVLTVDFGNKLLSDEDRAAVDNLKEALEGAGFTANYETSLDPDLATINALGGIPAGTKVSLYKGKPLSRVIDDLLFPTIQPTVVAPKCTLSLNTGVNNTMEIGSSAPQNNGFKTTWDRGSIKIGTSTLNYRAGEMISSSITHANGSSLSETDKITAGNNDYYYKVNYSEGPTPLDSKGNPSTSYTALPAGTITSTVCRIYGVYPFYASVTDSNITNGTVDKLPLTNNTQFTCTLAAESATVKHVFKIPHTITKIELKDPFGNWSNQPLEDFVKTTENIEVQGNSVLYNVYTRNQGQNGATEFRITYSK